MKSKKELSVDVLKAKKKRLVSFLIILASLIIIYSIYFITKLVIGTWQANNNTLEMVGLGVLVISISILTTQLSLTEKAIKSQNNQD